MKMKSYYAATVEAALKMATQEMGPDALLVNSRRTGADTRHLGEYEVVFAILPEQAAGDARRRDPRYRHKLSFKGPCAHPVWISCRWKYRI